MIEAYRGMEGQKAGMIEAHRGMEDWVYRLVKGCKVGHHSFTGIELRDIEEWKAWDAEEWKVENIEEWISGNIERWKAGREG